MDSTTSPEPLPDSMGGGGGGGLPPGRPSRTVARAPVRADARFMRARLSHWIALGFGSGLSPRAPGTVGTLLGWLSFVVADVWLEPVHWAVVLPLAFLAGIWACSRTGRDLGVADHGAIVWDEIVAIWLVLLFVPGGWVEQLGAFAVFRFFDIVKPPPIRYYDAKLKNGFGVMFDDLLAALYTLFVLALVGTSA